MADGLANFLLMKLREFLNAEEDLLLGVQAEAEYISEELEFMTTFLRVAEAMEDGDFQLKLIKKKFIDVVYDMEDALDDFKLRLTHDHGSEFFYSLRKVTRFLKSLKARHQIASKMRGIKTRVVHLAESHRRYLIRNNIMGQGVSSTVDRQFSRRWDAFQIEETDPVGIEGPKTHLIGWLFEDKSQLEVISVVGMGGLGKTTLVKNIYDDTEVQRRFEFRAWVTLSESLAVEEFLKDIIQQLSYVLRISDPQGLDSMDIRKLRMAVNDFLRDRKYLIVLDNVSDAKAWDAFGRALPNNNCGSRILLTTRNQTAAAALSHDKVYELCRLPEEDSWTLFRKKIFRDNSCPSHLENVMKKILLRRQGLPLAIVAVCGILAGKDNTRLERLEMLYRSLGSALENDDELKGVLLLGYNDLPYYLKPCLLYFSIFPVGNPIECMRLVRLWIAEGFVEQKEGITPEEVAEAYLNELIARSLVQVVETTSDGRVKSCRIHDILLEIIISKSIDQGFVAIAKEQRMQWPRKVRRLSIQNVLPRIRRRHVASRLRSLLMFRGSESLPESPLFNLPALRLRLLNVLDLGGTSLEEFPKEIVNLFLLKYLSLRNTKVISIPSSVGRLQNLETLDLRHAQVTELPAEILKLQKLRHLLVYRYEMTSDDQIHTKYGCKFPAQIGRLLFVQKLCFVEAVQGNNLMMELGKLNQLRRLGIVKLRKEDGEALCSSIELLRNLNALSVTSLEEGEIIDMKKLSSPPPLLQRLYLTGRLESIPDWISSLDGLAKVVLKWSRLNDDPLRSLEHLPNLVHLEFVQVYDGKKLCFQAQWFQSLKFLGLNKLDTLNTIIIEQGAMPHLKSLIIQDCKSLQRVPLGIEHLNELKEVEFFNMPLEFILSLHPNGEGQDYVRVEHVPDVYFTCWYDGKWDMYSLSEIFKERRNSARSAVSIIRRPRYVWK